ncbi:LacI family DNA-binding transcriptional regulator [Paracoccus gahaiensis]|uniref:LacI family DNA-binding transcriptional regulator n=1 Tax=Paracoccus gahaiensis TaxID=1706839 RepID=A0A4U0R4G0_9RHOB|nr:LacI family DNA-binding transcriptional regulator [Paracoccus gahaiensis]TJZ89729.1 LacI family DNA-binding transcriptional regulator [Paracoccus gahaiensis]
MDSTAGRRPTVKDVARIAGVSQGTVSNALSGMRGVDPETRQRIDQAIATLGYIPNLAARRMRTGRTNTIAVMTSMPAAVSAGSSRLGFLMEIAASAAIHALDYNSALVLVPPVADPAVALRHVAMDGAIVIEPQTDDAFLLLLKRRGVPVVVIGQPASVDLPWVDMHYYRTAEMLLAHLLTQGARRIALIVGTSSRVSHHVTLERYESWMLLEGIPPCVIYVPEADGEDGSYRATLDLLRSNPDIDGIFASIDAFASGVMRALRDMGRAVPSDVRVVTRYNGLRAREERPALTAVDLHLDQIAALATRLLMDLIAGREIERITAGPIPSLVVRGSS